MAVAWKLNAPVIAINSSPLSPWHFGRMANTYHPAYIPNVYMQFSEKMSFAQRLMNWLNFHLLNIMYKFVSKLIIEHIAICCYIINIWKMFLV